jgi:multiple sugar transport system substrate-binding protein
VLMRNWPYAYPLMNKPGSPIKGKFGLAPTVHGPGGTAVSCYGGGALGVNAFSRHPRAARQLVQFLLKPANLKVGARVVGLLPPLKSLYDDPELQAEFPHWQTLRKILFTARPRPITPLYSFISDSLRIHFSRALTRQETPAQALRRAQHDIAAVQRRFGRPGGAP